MNKILTIVGVFIWNVIIIFLLCFLIDNVDVMAASIFELNISEWWLTFVERRMINVLWATVLWAGVVSCILQFTYKYSKNLYSMIVLALLGNIALILLEDIYWSYIRAICFNLEGTMLENSFLAHFTSYDRMLCFWKIAICVAYSMEILVSHFEYFIKNKRQKIVWHQIFLRESSSSPFLCFGIPMLKITSGSYFLIEIIGVKIVYFLLLIILPPLIISDIIKIVEFIKVNQYYKNGMLSCDDKGIVVVQENGYLEKSFLYYKILKNRAYMKKLNAEGIICLPFELMPDVERKIKLDIYDTWMFIRRKYKKNKIVEKMTQQRGIFNIAHNEDEDFVENIAKHYDVSYSEVDKIIEMIVKLNHYTNYRFSQKLNMDKLKINECTSKNCIVDEINICKKYYEKTFDEFLVFDYSIKWLEIANYLYTLVILSKKEVSVSKETNKKIEYADFDKWREVRKSMLLPQEHISNYLNECRVDEPVFEAFDWVWLTVTSKRYNFNKYSIEELLEGANKLRDYTRGHGVYTFDISQSINLKLIEILIFLLNCLIDSNFLLDDISNLKKLGWIIYLDDVPYFLTSLDKKNNEYIYDSFQSQKRITIPTNNSGE